MDLERLFLDTRTPPTRFVSLASRVFTDEQVFLQFLRKGQKPVDYERQILRDHSERLGAIFRGEIVPPYELEIQPSAKCNLECEHCFGRFYDHLPEVINDETIEIIADSVCEYESNGFKVETAKFCGTTGEPLANPTTLKAIRLFKERGRKIILYSNGILLGHAFPDGALYADGVLKADKLNLSLDAGSEATFKELKGRDRFPEVLKGLEILAKRRAETGSNLHISASYVIGPKNYHEIVLAARKMKELGADDIWFRVDFTNLASIREIAPQIEKGLEQVKSLADERFKVVAVYSPDEIRPDSASFSAQGLKCYNHLFWACVAPDADLYACGHRAHKGSLAYGNLLKNSFKEIWESPRRKEIAHNLPDTICKVCSPSSSRRNEFIGFLFEAGGNRTKELCERYEDVLHEDRK